MNNLPDAMQPRRLALALVVYALLVGAYLCGRVSSPPSTTPTRQEAP